jgi:hypothetical protein
MFTAQLVIVAFLVAAHLIGHCLAHECSQPLVHIHLNTTRFSDELQSTCHNLLSDYFRYGDQEEEQAAQDWDQARLLYKRAIAKLISVSDFNLEQRKNYLYFIKLYMYIIESDNLWSLLVDLEHDFKIILEEDRNTSFCQVPKPRNLPATTEHSAFINSFCSEFSFGVDKLLGTFDTETYCPLTRNPEDCALVSEIKRDDFRVKFNGCTMRYVLLARGRSDEKIFLDFGPNGSEYSDDNSENYMNCLNRFVVPDEWPDELKRYVYFHAVILLKPLVLHDAINSESVI